MESKCKGAFFFKSFVKDLEFLRRLERIFDNSQESPRKDFIFFGFLASGKFSMAFTFGGLGFTPSLVIMWSRF